MPQALTLKKSININAPISKVWEALTNPELIKKYFFGTECVTDWKKGSPILYKEKFILYNYWSSFSRTADLPENYATIKYELSNNNNNETTLTIIQEGFKTQEAHDHSDTNWGYITDGMKKMLEG